MLAIKEEAKADSDAIRQVTIAAFASSEFGHNGEADLVDELRSKCNDRLSLVAFDDDVLVGHILFTPVLIRTSHDEVHGMGLAPMSVLPSHQRSGVGSALISAGLKRLAASGNLFTVVAGHLTYYPRFGFLPASDFEILHGFEGMPQDIFFIHANSADTLDLLAGGAAYYHPVFGPQHVSA